MLKSVISSLPHSSLNGRLLVLLFPSQHDEYYAQNNDDNHGDDNGKSQLNDVIQLAPGHVAFHIQLGITAKKKVKFCVFPGVSVFFLGYFFSRVTFLPLS